MKLSRLFIDFFESERAAGLVLIGCTIISLLLANTSFASHYLAFWQLKIGTFSIEHLINDGLMAVFFLLIGLELEREIYGGELSNTRNAALPVMAAMGGMAVPSLVYLGLNSGTSTQAGAGIPMATDIAFALGILSLLGKRIPNVLKIFLTALAVIDDLGAIVVIAFFYTKQLSFLYLACSLTCWGILLIFNRLKIHYLPLYIIGGILLWYFMLLSGVHTTISGVLLAFALPYQNGKATSISYRLQHTLHKPVAFFILPIFALANTCLVFPQHWNSIFANPNSNGILLGLVVGKPVGILLFSWLSIRLNIVKLPPELSIKHLLGAGFLGGIGFTMSIFITTLAFDKPNDVLVAKISILVASFIASLLGFIWLLFFTKNLKFLE